MSQSILYMKLRRQDATKYEAVMFCINIIIIIILTLQNGQVDNQITNIKPIYLQV